MNVEYFDLGDEGFRLVKNKLFSGGSICKSLLEHRTLKNVYALTASVCVREDLLNFDVALQCSLSVSVEDTLRLSSEFGAEGKPQFILVEDTWLTADDLKNNTWPTNTCIIEGYVYYLIDLRHFAVISHFTEVFRAATSFENYAFILNERFTISNRQLVTNDNTLASSAMISSRVSAVMSRAYDQTGLLLAITYSESS